MKSKVYNSVWSYIGSQELDTAASWFAAGLRANFLRLFMCACACLCGGRVSAGAPSPEEGGESPGAQWQAVVSLLT